MNHTAGVLATTSDPKLPPKAAILAALKSASRKEVAVQPLAPHPALLSSPGHGLHALGLDYRASSLCPIIRASPFPLEHTTRSP